MQQTPRAMDVYVTTGDSRVSRPGHHHHTRPRIPATFTNESENLKMIKIRLLQVELEPIV